jgi:hypothetical protein
MIPWIALCAMGCASATGTGTPDGGTVRRDGGSAADGGAAPDGGASADGGRADGGAPTDGGAAADGGISVDGGAADGGADGGACPSVSVTAASTSAGIDCDGTIDPAVVRAQVCPPAGQRIATGLYDETRPEMVREWEVEGDGSGNVILACRDSIDEARTLIQSQHLGLTGCEAETGDYYSFEGSVTGPPTFFLRVNKCNPWPYIRSEPNSTTPQAPGIGQVGPVGVTLTAELAAHVAQYLWYVDRDFRTDFYLLGGRPVTGPPIGHALCEAEVAPGSPPTVTVRRVTFTIDAVSRDIERAVQDKTTFACP